MNNTQVVNKTRSMIPSHNNIQLKRMVILDDRGGSLEECYPFLQFAFQMLIEDHVGFCLLMVSVGKSGVLVQQLIIHHLPCAHLLRPTKFSFFWYLIYTEKMLKVIQNSQICYHRKSLQQEDLLNSIIIKKQIIIKTYFCCFYGIIPNFLISPKEQSLYRVRDQGLSLRDKSIIQCYEIHVFEPFKKLRLNGGPYFIFYVFYFLNQCFQIKFIAEMTITKIFLFALLFLAFSYNVQACCPSSSGFCDDKTKGTPCCGYGKCNIFCCNCNGGCRVAPPCGQQPTQSYNKKAFSKYLEGTGITDSRIHKHLFKELDVNKDGKIDKNEITSGKNTPVKKIAAKLARSDL